MAVVYRAFISYSHRDARFARRFHADLEAWRVDRALVGRETLVGPVPRTVRPIFRDRDDFAGGRTVGDATRDALAASTFMIVLCSPDAADSDYVAEEIRVFKSMGRADRIIPVIVSGEPGDLDRECFPKVLTREVDADGVVTGRSVEPLAADAREQGDGRRRALIKVVAGLLGVSFDELAKRAETAQRRRTRIASAIAGVMFILAVSAGGFAWLSEARRVVAERNYTAALDAADSLLGEVGEELINIEGIQLETVRRVIDRATSIFDRLAVSLPDEPELKLRKIPVMVVFARGLAAKGDLAGSIEILREAEIAAQTLAVQRSDDEVGRALLARVRWRLGGDLAASGDSAGAIASLDAAVSSLESLRMHFAKDEDNQRELASATVLLSALLANEGRLDEAARYASAGVGIFNRLALAHPADWRFRMTLATARIAEADILRGQGELDAAAAVLTDAERALETGLRERPDMPQVRRALAVVQVTRASVLEELGRVEQADAARLRSEANYRHLASADAEDRDARREHADDQAESAKALARDGAMMDAAAAYAQSIATLEEMHSQNPDDWNVETSLQLALSSASENLGDGGLYQPAESAARRLLEFREAEHGMAPTDREAMESVAWALHLLARATEGNGAWEEALTLRRRELSLAQALYSGGSDHWLYLLIEAHRNTGYLAWRLSMRAEALPHFDRQVELLTGLLSESPDDESLRIDLGHALLNLGELRALNDDGVGSLDAFERCLALRAALVDEGFDSPARLTELAWAEARLAQFGDQPLSRWARVQELLSRADGVEPLGDLEDELLTASRIALSARRQ